MIGPRPTACTAGRRVVGRLAALGVACTLVASCAMSSTTASRRGAPTSSTAPAAPGGPLEWSACGAISCATLSVPLNHAQPRGEVLSLPVFARASRTGFGSDVVVLITDREVGESARAVVERAPLTLGMASADYTVVSLTVRGSAGAPLPGGAETLGGSLDVVDDLQLLLATLGVRRSRVIGWGSGATIGAAWVMTHPGTVHSAVLDTPADPSSSFVRQGIARRDSFGAGVKTMMRWCASHLSCPLNQETRREWLRLMNRIDNGDVPAALTRDLVDRAGHAALLTGQFGLFFRAFESAFADETVALEALAAQVPPAERGNWQCGDYRRTAARILSAAWRKNEWRWLTPGNYAQLFAACAQGTEPARPLGALTPVPGARGARVFVTLARSDATASTKVPFAMSKKMKWSYRSVPGTGHLVVGRDRVITSKAMEFLGG